MKIDAFTIENLRAIKGPLRFDHLRDIEVLHGDNNAGKSSALLGLALGLHLWQEHHRLGLGPGEGEAEDEAGVGLMVPPELGALRPHRHRAQEASRVSIELDHPQLARLEYHLRPAAGVARRWFARARWWAPGEEGEGHRSKPPVAAPDWALVQVQASVDREASLIQARRADRSGEVRRRWKELERALRTFAAELGPGELGEVAIDRDKVELAWIGEDERPRPFSEEGSGLRAVKDILVAACSGGAQVLLLEEPERHLSASSEARLRQLLDGLAARGCQVLLTSHSYGFDGPTVWRLNRRGDEGVEAARSEPPPSEPPPSPFPEGAPALPAEQERRLMAEYAAQGSPSVGFVSRAGLTRLPPELLGELQAPTTIVWARKRSGVYGAMSVAALYRDEGDEGNGGETGDDVEAGP